MSIHLLGMYDTCYLLSEFHSGSYGRVYAWEKSYDRITTKNEQPLHLVDRIKYNTTTSDDPVIQEVSTYLASASLLAC